MYCSVWILGLIAISQVIAYRTRHSTSKSNLEVDNQKHCVFNGDIDNMDFRLAHFNFSINLYKATAAHTCKTKGIKEPHFAMSANMVWITLSAMAEASEGEIRKELFEVLNLPEDECLRKAFYQKALFRDQTNIDVVYDKNRILFVDQSMHINKAWSNFVTTYHGLEIAHVPLKSDPIKAALEMRRVISSGLKHLNMTGNSAMINSLDYEGLWTTAFPNAVTEKVPFYDDNSKHIGYVDMMRTKLYARMGFVKSMKCKVLEIPAGENGRYRVMLVQRIVEGTIPELIEGLSHTLLSEALQVLYESRVPIDVAVPRLTIDTENDVRAILENMGVKAIWQNPDETGKISRPAAFPTSYLQRSSVSFDTAGINPVQNQSNPSNKIQSMPGDLHPECDPVTGLDPLVGQEFIANKTMLYAIYDESFTSLVHGVYSIPTYSLDDC